MSKYCKKDLHNRHNNGVKNVLGYTEVRVQNETSGYLKLVDVSNANIIASTAISSDNYFYELQVDNFSFAREAYNLSATNQSRENNLMIYKAWIKYMNFFPYISYTVLSRSGGIVPFFGGLECWVGSRERYFNF